MKALRAALAAAAMLWLAACAGVANDDAVSPGLDQAALLTASCSGCHAAGGSVEGIHSLEGMSSAELQTKLLAYRNSREGESAMHRMARGYSVEEIDLIANTLGE